MQYINGKLGYTQWAWGDTNELLIVTLDRDGNVRHWSSIVRRRNGGHEQTGIATNHRRSAAFRSRLT